jgi:hypothetical protein
MGAASFLKSPAGPLGRMLGVVASKAAFPLTGYLAVQKLRHGIVVVMQFFFSRDEVVKKFRYPVESENSIS